MVLYGVLFLHLLVCISTVYGQCFTEYHSEMACVVPYGVPMHGTFSRSLMDCARACSINDSCASVILIEGTNTCFLNEQILTEITVLCPNPQQYAQKTGVCYLKYIFYLFIYMLDRAYDFVSYTIEFRVRQMPSDSCLFS
jgi:hypothetical protein